MAELVKILSSLASDSEIIRILNAKCSLGCTPLYYSCYYGDYQMFCFLLEKGADSSLKNNEGVSCLHVAAQSGNLSIFFHLTEVCKFDLFGCDGNESNALHWACTNGSVQIVDFLLGLEFPLNHTDKEGNTALHSALFSSRNVIS